MSRLVLCVLTLGLAFGVLAEPSLAEDVTVPNVVGKSPDDAKKQLEALGILVEVVEVAEKPVGRVYEQEPPAGIKIPKDDLVILRTGFAGRIETTMPNVVGKSVDEAMDTLLPVYDARFEPTIGPEAKAGTVARTEPAAGSKLLYRGVVRVFIYETELPGGPEQPGPDTSDPVPPTGPVPPSVPPPPTGSGNPAVMAVVVPDVLGQDEASARTRLEGAGLKVETSDEISGFATPGRVLRIVPNIGSEVVRGSTVVITVARSPNGDPQGPPEGFPDDPSGVPPPPPGGQTPQPGWPAQPVQPGNPPQPSAPPIVRGPMFGGLTLPPGAEVPIFLFERQETEVPRLLGITWRDAQRRAVAAGLVVRPWLVRPSGRVAPYQVVSQSIRAGTVTQSGETIDIKIALPYQGMASVVGMPALVGLTSDDASRILTDLDIRVEIVAPPGTGGSGIVVWQDTPREQPVQRRAKTVRIYVAPPTGIGRPPAPVVDVAPPAPAVAVRTAPGSVPNLGGMGATQAVSLAQGAGFQPRVRYAIMPEAMPGEVAIQYPLGGERASRGTAINLTVPQSVDMPGVVGLSLRDAAGVLSKQGIAIKIQPRTRGHDTVRVIAQYPEAGQPIAVGSEASLRLADEGRGAGPPPPTFVTIPRLVGQPAAQAEAQVNSLGLRAQVEGPRSSGGSYIRSQSFAPGARIRRGTTVILRR